MKVEVVNSLCIDIYLLKLCNEILLSSQNEDNLKGDTDQHTEVGVKFYSTESSESSKEMSMRRFEIVRGNYDMSTFES